MLDSRALAGDQINHPRWALAIFASREALATLIPTLEAARLATDTSIVIDVLINGNSQLADSLVDWLSNRSDEDNWGRLRVWSIVVGDKANAWNQYFHKIWSGQELAFFSDGYVRITPDSIKVLGNAVRSNSYALGGSGVPSIGRTAKSLAQKLLRDGGFSGGLCCIRGDVIARLKAMDFFVPLGLYRSDGLLGAMLSFGLDPERNQWDPRRIQLHERATWTTDPKHWWKLSDIRDKVKRTLRQARGNLENEAIKDHFLKQKQSPSLLPKTASALIFDWMARRPEDARSTMLRHPLTQVVLRSLKRTPDWSDSNIPPKLLWAGSQSTAGTNDFHAITMSATHPPENERSLNLSP